MTDLAPDAATDLTALPGPVGHRGPRGWMLLWLKREGSATAGDLARALGFSLNAVRHHLKELEAEGVVEYDRSHRGVGAPAHAFHLSPAGHALFPDRYQQTVADLLDHLVATGGRQAAVDVLTARYRQLGERFESELRGLPAERRGPVLARLLDGEGYMATWNGSAGGGVLTEHNCPHRVIAERFPEVCQAEEEFLSRLFGAPVERTSRIAAGCGTCSYRVAGEAAPKEGAA